MINKKRVLVMGLYFLLSVEATACVSQKDISGINAKDIGIEYTENSSFDTEKTKASEYQNEKNNQETGQVKTDICQDATSLVTNANLQGNIVAFSDMEISLSIATIETTDGGGEEMAQAAPGMENAEELDQVTYAQNVAIQILVMDRASQTPISLNDSEKSSIQEQTSVLVFGTCQDTNHWTAEKVVLVSWQ